MSVTISGVPSDYSSNDLRDDIYDFIGSNGFNRPNGGDPNYFRVAGIIYDGVRNSFALCALCAVR